MVRHFEPTAVSATASLTTWVTTSFLCIPVLVWWLSCSWASKFLSLSGRYQGFKHTDGLFGFVSRVFMCLLNVSLGSNWGGGEGSVGRVVYSIFMLIVLLHSEGSGWRGLSWFYLRLTAGRCHWSIALFITSKGVIISKNSEWTTGLTSYENDNIYRKITLKLNNTKISLKPYNIRFQVAEPIK